MCSLMVTEALFRVFGFTSFERYYRLAHESQVQRIRTRRLELGFLILLSLYFAQLQLIFFFYQLESQWVKIALFDLVSLFHAISYFNLVLASTFLLCAYCIYAVFFEPNALFTQRWVSSVVNFQSDPVLPRHFNRWRWHRFYQHQTRLATIRRLCHRAFPIAHANLASIHGTFVLVQIVLFQHLASLQHTHPVPLFKLLTVALCGEVHILAYTATLAVCVHTELLTAGLFMLTTLLLHHALDRANTLLVRASKNSRLATYQSFAITHTRVFLETLRINQFISKLYFIFVLISFPINALMVMTLLLGRANLKILPYVLLSIFINSMVQSIMHRLMVRYNGKIHWHSKLLMRLSANRSFDLTNNLRVQLHIDCYVAKFHTRNQYGITNGPLGVVTNQSAAKKIFYYFRMFIFSYHFVMRAT